MQRSGRGQHSTSLPPQPHNTYYTRVRSGFGDGTGHKLERTELEEVLKAAGVTDVFVVGVALDFCVAYTCKDAVAAGFRTFCVRDACRGIATDTIDKELAAMAAVGVRVLERADDVPTADLEDAVRRGIVGGATAHVPPPAGGVPVVATPVAAAAITVA